MCRSLLPNAFDPHGLTVDQFVKMLQTVPWLENLGASTEFDGSVVRIHTWDEWPGPEDPGALGCAAESETWRKQLFAHASQSAVQSYQLHRQPYETQQLWDYIQCEIVIPLAARQVAYDEHADCYHGPTAAVWHAGWLAAVIGCRLLLHFDLDDNAIRQWSWFARGHWPFGYDDVDQYNMPCLASTLQVF